MRHPQVLAGQEAKRLPRHAVEPVVVHNVPAADHLRSGRKHPGTLMPTVMQARAPTKAIAIEVADHHPQVIQVVTTGEQRLQAQPISERPMQDPLVGQQLI